MKHENFLELLLFSEFIIDSHYITMNQQKLYTKLLEVFSFTKLDSTVSKTPPDKLMPFGLKNKTCWFFVYFTFNKKRKAKHKCNNRPTAKHDPFDQLDGND